MGSLDANRRLEIRNERLHRLRLLELRQARQGIETPPDVVIEIAETRAELGLSDLLVAEKSSSEFAQEIGADGQFLIMTRLFDQLGKRMETIAAMHDARMSRMEDHQDATNGAQDLARIKGQRRSRLAMFAIALALIVLAISMLFVVVALRRHGF